MKRIFTEEFKLFISRVLPFVLLLILIPLISYLIWMVLPAKEMEIVVIDKTVPTDTYQEHQTLFWAFEYMKIQNKQGQFYAKDKDYFGFFPDESPSFGTPRDLRELSEIEIKEAASKLDILYFADTYGVFEDDFEKEPSDEISKKIYGGLNRGDISLMREVAAQHKTIIAEFNTMASPTPIAIRTEFENIMGLKWTGWIARYFDEMDTTINADIPKWFISQYVEQHQNTWVQPGPGIVFVHENGTVEAFSNEVDYLGRIPKIRTQRINQLGFKLPEIVPYPDWFDIVLIERDYQVISYYDIDPTDLGKEKLRSMGLPRFFPAAVVKNVGKGQYYYLAGDFSDMQNPLGSPHFKGLPMLWRGLHTVSDFTDRESFYWNYFYPLLSQIMDKTYKEKLKD
ncbi:hypothetical protein [Algoriphagus aquimarinus]|uniref:Uncharacterized protein n=1 Tax=Algoriphagus aquimarinus TaxID=237018 RepID=A0A1I0YH69_9BACT|nr:hypothetical protein [Algoriphagus aquimarinus]SFB12561.1 hypothetical protein SAMN04489723_104330 [Algoriphagus aquimarinus]